MPTRKVTVRERATLADRLLHAITPEQVADVMLDSDASLAPSGTCVLWSDNWPHGIASYPSPSLDPGVLAAAHAALQDWRDRSQASDTTHVLCDADGATAVLHLPAGHEPLPAAELQAAGARMAEVLAIQRLHGTVAQLAQAEQLQRALFAIADMAGSDLDMPDMLRGLHRIVGELMYAENFYIALYNEADDNIRFLYFVDSVDAAGPTTGDEFPLDRIKHGPTWWTIHERKPWMGTTEQLQAQIPGPLNIHGADSHDWLGVPMLRDGQVRGVMVVQSYLPDVTFSSTDMALLGFVGEHILTALERKQGQEELERRVEERTAQLAETNEELRQEVAERQRGERLQSALYQIAALASIDESSDRFFGHVHAIVSDLLNADNFYIALVSEDGATLEFPYRVDRNAPHNSSRPLGRGLTEYTLRSGRAQLVDGREAALSLIEAGEIDQTYIDSPTACWLGVPLIGSEASIGVVAVQSYTPDVRYDQRDAELLTFVSYQLASSIQRRRAADALLTSHIRLEERVEERTLELREQIAVREQIEAQLQHQVMHDPLTGLPNRLYLRDRVERAIAGVRRNEERRFALLYLDVDRFKIINDSLGHLAGDQVLQEVARRLGECVREPDVVARLSGDEFALLLEDAPVPQTASKVAQRVLEALKRPLLVNAHELHTSASIGIAIGDRRYQSTDELLRDADVALYRAKSAGRQRFVMFDDSLQRNAMDVLGLEQELREALAAGQFEPYFQPLVRLSDTETVGYESLVRWHHPQRGLLLPGEFLRVAEDSGQIEAIDWQMYSMACTAGAALVRDSGFITINISPRHFQNEDLDERLLAVTSDTGFDPAKLRIEVTEGTLLGDPAAVAKVLQRLRAACIEAALDDFGTGYSSLGYVHRFPLKMIKIDQSFVAPLGHEESPRSLAVIGAILALARSLGLEVVAEGIETEHQLRILRDMGCVYGQGYFFGRPQPAAHWLALREAQAAPLMA
jgi:diguanylate cyclase (GGDEF)-like protein